ncbi:sortase B [Trichococcus patagoniensis]|uniref:Sortase B n=1 Tax=Trichococcus patagoniensis TaxID=382641 RepID=A0A2T5IHG5_9LACT|nr:class B sortase [Trichococcus patagoniensis]PTQ83283.1 sortase B [Trichococcus patagoniensis]
MQKSIWVLLLTKLLFLQIIYFGVQEIEQRKDVVVPEKKAQVAVPQQMASSTDFRSETDSSEEAAVPLEELTFTINPSAEYYQMNPDYVGWLSVNGTVIDYPVVRGQDNEMYLSNNFYREPDIFGAIFMDYRNIGMGIDRHTIIYGHYTQYGQMFGELDKFLNEDFLKENLEFTFSDGYGQRRYRIFSVHVAPADTSFLDIDFEGNEYTDFLAMLKNLSVFPSDVAVTEENNILTLMTCNDSAENGRLFIHAVEVTE